MRARVLLFAAARERAGTADLEVELSPGSCARDVVEAAVARAPALGPIAAQLRVALNQAFVADDVRVVEGDEIALLPPVSGGSGRRVGLSEAPLSLADVVAAVSDAAHGAVATFSGVVRDHSDGHRVRGLDYEAYRPMAQRELEGIADELAARHPGVRLAMVHRLGALGVGELAVVIAAGAAHRREALVACAEAIDLIKARVPIWKREHTVDGEARWVGCVGCQAARGDP